MRTRRTNRWRGVVAVALFVGAVGLLAKRPLVLLAAVVGVVFAAYPQLRGAPAVELSLDRRLDTETPEPGDDVEVTVTVRNDGDRTLWDLRLVDGVPAMLTPVGGTARHTAVLRPGASTTFSYTLRAEHGTHRFGPTTVIARDPSGATEVETTVSARTRIECHAVVPEAPLRRRTQPAVGRLLSDEGGSGVEFHRTREYRRGDPMGRVDWKRFARTEQLTTVEFREERAPSVVLCLDARRPSYCGNPDEPHAVSHCLAAVESLLASLSATRERVGLAALGREFCWLAPGAGDDHLVRAQELLATHPAFAPTPPDGDVDADRQVEELKKRLGRDVQVVLFSPLADAAATRAATSLEAAGHPVTLVSPDVTATETLGDRLAAVSRENELATLRGAGVAVVDWAPDEPLGTAIIDARRGWPA